MKKNNFKKIFNVSLIFCLFLLFTFLSNISYSYAVENKSTKIAVIPFKNLSSEQKYDWIGNGFAETMVSSLMNIKNLQVVERFLMSDVIKEVAFQQSGFVDENDTLKIGKMTGANVIISGSYQISNDEIVINARFINIEKSTAESGFYIRGKLSEIFNLQEKLANSFNEKFNIKLSNQEEKNIKNIIYATKSTEAQELYLKARELSVNGGGIKIKEESIKLLEKAVKIDPNYSLAWAFLGERYLSYSTVLKFLNDFLKLSKNDELINLNKKGISALEKAISLSPNYETYRALAKGFFYLDEKDNTEKYIKKALELKPDDVESIIFYASLKNINLLEELEKAKKIDPFNYEIYYSYGMYYLYYIKTGTKEENLKLAEENFLKAVELNKYSWNANMQLVQTYMRLNQFDKSIAWSERMIEMEKDVLSYIISASPYLAIGNFPKVRETYQEIDKMYTSPFVKGFIVQIYIFEKNYPIAYRLGREGLELFPNDPSLNNCMSQIYNIYFKDCKSALYHFKIFLDNYDKMPFVDPKLKKMSEDEYKTLKNICKQK